MFGVERYEKILEMLQGDRATSVKKLAKSLYVSEATVRRDLESLEKNGLIKRIYGGAMLIKSNKDVPLYMRESEQTEAKNIIGKKAAALVKENDVILIDASSTAYSVIPYLTGFTNLLAITSGLKAAMALGEKHIKTLVTGGVMIDNSYSFIGRHAEHLIENINADLFFFSCRGITTDGRLTDSSMEESQMRQLMFKHAKRKIFLAASSKIGREFFYTLCPIDDVDDMICETEEIPEDWKRRMRKG